MSEPSYRITTEHDPAATYNPWSARVTQLSDDTDVGFGYGQTEAEALLDARTWIGLVFGGPSTGHEFYATENGAIFGRPPA